jgi:DNA-binding transcriptional LysR family regulator
VAPKPLGALLAKQRAEEPETQIVFQEIVQTELELEQGIEEGRFDLGFSLVQTKKRGLKALPLWNDELVAAVPERSPLLAHVKVPLEVLGRYPLVKWTPQASEVISFQIDEILKEIDVAPEAVQYVPSFELMAVWVAAGYGVGFGQRSRIAAAREWGVLMRPLAGSQRTIKNYILCSDMSDFSAAGRFTKRATSISWS